MKFVVRTIAAGVISIIAKIVIQKIQRSNREKSSS